MTGKIASCIVLAVCCATPGPDARAVVLISNLNGNDFTHSSSLDDLRNKGMGFTMPTGPDYRLDNAVLRLYFTFTDSIPVVQIWSNSASNLPDSPLLTLSDPQFSFSDIGNYTFTSPTTFTLQSGKTYWLVAHGSHNDGFDWMANDPGIVPTGIATHFGQHFDTDGPPPTGDSFILNSYAINATIVPEPASLVLFAFIVCGLLVVAYRRRA